MTDAKNAENAEKFHCINCDFVCSKQSDYNRHLLTLKHTNTDKILTKYCQILPKKTPKTPLLL